MTKVETTPAIIDGETVITDEIIEVRAPFDGNLVGSVPRCGKEHLDRAVKAAHRELKANALAPWERAAILDRVAELLVERRDAFAHLIASEAGKPITVAEGEAGRAVNTLTYAAIAARTLTGETVPMAGTEKGDGTIAWTERVPIGVIGAISPFNFPLNLVCHKVAPAIAAGCPVVLKPASATPLTALMLAEVFAEAGLPAGWLNVVTAPGSESSALVEHEDVAMITFTGSPDVGWGIKESAPRKKVTLELGNNAPVIVEPDADLDVVVPKLRTGGFLYSGQTCIAIQRIYAHSDIHDELLERLKAEVEQIVTGDPLDHDTEVSALIESGETDRVEGWIEDAVRAGATRVTGGGRNHDGAVLMPTVLAGVTPDMEVSKTELFGPAVGVASYDTFDEAVGMANNSRYGLQASVFTSSLQRAMEAAERIDFGSVLINEQPNWRTDQMPYGGVRDSGTTKEGPPYAVEEMTRERLIIIRT